MQGQLNIDLSALAWNYEYLKGIVGPSCILAPVVKADAYGCGANSCAQVLFSAGARDFFVATLDEALELRSALKGACRIYTLNGFDEAQAHIYRREDISAVLNTAEQIVSYARHAADAPLPRPLLHVDTGMNRLGIRPEDIPRGNMPPLAGVISHLSSSEDAGSESNIRQRERFERVRSLFPGLAASLSNSGGIFLGPEYHYDMVRPGMALYGLNPQPGRSNPMRRVIDLRVPVLQVRRAKAGETCGYNETFTLENDTVLATLAVGYADGFLRSLSGRGRVFWKDWACPVRGRVSMDLTIVDLSGVPESALPGPGDFLEVIGPHQGADDLARDAGTIGYEILTSLGSRYRRIFSAN